MSNKFSDFTNKQFEDLVQSNKAALDGFAQQNSDQYNSINNLIGKYSSMSNNQLFSEFMRVAQQMKAEGTLNLAYIENIKQTIFPYLSAEQQQMFYEFMNYLR